jgi:6-phosphogluconate dehydrogenase
MIGLGRMGGNMVRRLMRGGHTYVIYDRNPAAVEELSQVGAQGANDVSAFSQNSKKPRTVWIVLPAGAVTEDMVKTLCEKLKRATS